MSMAGIGVKPGFEWGRVVWGKPESPRSKLCSLCFCAIGDSDVPLILTTEKGFVAQFCDDCVVRWWTRKS